MTKREKVKIVLKAIVNSWTWWHTAAAIIPLISAMIIIAINGGGFIQLLVQYIGTFWLLSCADQIRDERLITVPVGQTTEVAHV